MQGLIFSPSPGLLLPTLQLHCSQLEYNMMSRTLSLSLLSLVGLINIWIDYSFVQDIRKVLEKRPPPFSHYSTRLGHYRLEPR